MFRLGRIGILTILCWSFPFTANRASAAGFDITHWTNYFWMPLPGTVGESVTFGWYVDATDHGLSGLPGVADETPVAMSGTIDLGPLLSLDAKWDADGTIGEAQYLFGEGIFELGLDFNLADGTPHTMNIRGELGPTSVTADDYSSSEIILSLRHAKVDPKSAALFGMKRQITGSTYYYTDLYDMGSPDRELALFGLVYFDYTPVKNHKSGDMAAVPEPAPLVLTVLGVAAAIRRRRSWTS